jgi:hypothetical protein
VQQPDPDPVQVVPAPTTLTPAPAPAVQQRAPWLSMRPFVNSVLSDNTQYTKKIEREGCVMPKTVFIHPYTFGEYSGVNFFLPLSCAHVLPEGFSNLQNQGPEAIHKILKENIGNIPASKNNVDFFANIQTNPFPVPGSTVPQGMFVPFGVNVGDTIPNQHTRRALKPQYLMEGSGERSENVECWVHAVNSQGATVSSQYFSPEGITLHTAGNASGDSHHINGIDDPNETFVVYWRVDRPVSEGTSVYGVNVLLSNDCAEFMESTMGNQWSNPTWDSLDFNYVWGVCNAYMQPAVLEQLHKVLGCE